MEKEIELIEDYELEISNIQTKKDNQTQEEATVYEKGEKIIVSFNSTNKSQYYPEKVVINGKEYDVTKKENQYTVLIDGIQETGEKEIIIEEA